MLENKLLDPIKQIKAADFDKLDDLCQEIREKLIQTISKNGGHLASNLGVVELTVALHKVFDSPTDQFIWDVSHQSYTHKLLTGRAELFDTIRQYEGLSGYTKISESPHDAFGAGHSSTSISAALGIAKAKTMTGEPGYSIAIIGDGAFTGGMAYEAINNAGRGNDKIIIILNDNEMSISHNVGSMAKYLAEIRNMPTYFHIKDTTENILVHIPLIGKFLNRFLVFSKQVIKDYFFHSNFFENMGLTYLGPVDGHNIRAMTKVLNRAKELNKPVIVHALTVKGKGYTHAENMPDKFHGISEFDIETGDALSLKGESFSAAFGNKIKEMAEKDKKICAVSAAMISGTGLQDFDKTRLFDVGIAESHAVTFAAGLAKNGMLPVFAIYSSFLQRAYDQIVHDVCLQNLKVVFAIDRAGIVGEDGETHQGVFDIGFLNAIPNMTIFSPATYVELGNDLNYAFYGCDGPVAVRYQKGSEVILPKDYISQNPNFDFYGENSAKILIVTYGRLFGQALLAKRKLKQIGIDVMILKLNRIKPIDSACLENINRFENILFFEEGMIISGIGEHFGAKLSDFKGKYKIFGIDNIFVPHGSVSKLLSVLGLDADGMIKSIKQECNLICD